MTVKKEMIMLNNLSCPTCASDLEKAFKKMDGIKDASVTFATGTLNVEYDESKVNSKQIERTIKNFGVGVASRM